MRLSNLSRATNPFSKVLSSNALSVAPDKDTLLLHLVLPNEKEVPQDNIPRVMYIEDENFDEFDQGSNTEDFIKRLSNAIAISKDMKPPRMTIELPGEV